MRMSNLVNARDEFRLNLLKTTKIVFNALEGRKLPLRGMNLGLVSATVRKVEAAKSAFVYCKYIIIIQLRKMLSRDA